MRCKGICNRELAKGEYCATHNPERKPCAGRCQRLARITQEFGYYKDGKWEKDNPFTDVVVKCTACQTEYSEGDIIGQAENKRMESHKA